MKDLFAGSLGRLDDKGGSRAFTTPHTVKIEPSYSINFNINREFVTCSLDGKLWLYGKNNVYVLFALKWNSETGKLEQGASINIRNEKLIARGNNYLITDKKVYSASDISPYIFSRSLFDESDSNERFLYSILRSGVVDGSGIDIFTGEAWGKSEDNGNSEGYGLFNKSGFLSSVELSYAVLPTIDNWIITGKFLVLKPDIDLDSLDNEENSEFSHLKNSYNGMIASRPLIPLEIHNGAAYYGTGYQKRDVQIAYIDGKLFARGLYNLGRAYILPAVFNSSGEPEEFYLYISPDYVRSETENLDDWLNLSPLAFINEKNYSLLGVITEQINSLTKIDESINEIAGNLNNNVCVKTKNTKVFKADNNSWNELDNEDKKGQIFIDFMNSAAMFLNSNGINLLHDNLQLNCKNLQQWLLPVGTPSCISHNFIIANTQNSSLATNLRRGFYRNVLQEKVLPMTFSSFKKVTVVDKNTEEKETSNIKLAIDNTKNSNNRYNLSINEIQSQQNTKQIIKWHDLYKKPIDIKCEVYKTRYIYNIGMTWMEGTPFCESVPNSIYGQYEPGKYGEVNTVLYYDMRTGSIYFPYYFPEIYEEWEAQPSNNMSMTLDNFTYIWGREENDNFLYPWGHKDLDKTKYPAYCIFSEKFTGTKFIFTFPSFTYDNLGSRHKLQCPERYTLFNCPDKNSLVINGISTGNFHFIIGYIDGKYDIQITRLHSVVHPDVFNFQEQAQRSKLS